MELFSQVVWENVSFMSKLEGFLSAHLVPLCKAARRTTRLLTATVATGRCSHTIMLRYGFLANVLKSELRN